MAHRQNRRGRPKKKLNRYDPNNPSFAAVHGPKYLSGFSSFLVHVQPKPVPAAK